MKCMHISKKKTIGYVVLAIWAILVCIAALKGRPSIWRKSFYNFIPAVDMVKCFIGVIQGKLPERIIVSWIYQVISGVLFGIGISFTIKKRSQRDMFYTFVCPALAFTMINAARYIIHVGFFDVTDIILGVVGANVGICAGSYTVREE